MYKSIISMLMVILPFTIKNLSAQSGAALSQTIRGTITDKVATTPLPGANIVILNTDPLLGTASDMDGNFKISKVPVGKYTLRITYLGYKEILLPNIIVNSGKEVVLSILLEENFVQGNEVQITYKQDKS